MPDLDQLIKTQWPGLAEPGNDSCTVIHVQVGSETYWKVIWNGCVLVPDWLEPGGADSALLKLQDGTAEVVDGAIRWKLV